METAPEGGYRLADQQSLMLTGKAPQCGTLDRHLRALGWAKQDA